MLDTAKHEDWKLKYRELLTELESKQSEWTSMDKALRGVASRLAITAMGRDARVDGHLETILDAIKGRHPETTLRTGLDDLSAAVLRHEQTMALNDTVDLSSFVASLKIAPAAQKRCIDGLEAESAVARMRALTELAGELNEVLERASAATPADDPAVVLKQFLKTLARHMERVPGLGAAVDELKARLHGNDGGEASEALLESLIDSVSHIIEAINDDKSELEAFLEQVTQQLARFEAWTSGNENEARGRRQDTDSLEANVQRQFSGVQSDMDASQGMADLKQRVQSRLDAIATHLTVFRQSETQRLHESDRRNSALRDEINRLKHRTTELAARCNDQERRLMHDTLTGAHTRYAYEQRLQEEFQRWHRHGQSLTYSIWDIDFFKRVNDTWGHQIGDRLLAVVAGMLLKQTRTEDFVARIGGEEFVVLFPATSLDRAAALANRLRENIANAGFHYKGTPIPATVSCGITEFRDGDTPKSVYERADQALYQAKNGGRNLCVEI